ncbi:hypothetical protein [Paludibacterium sp. B53371]|uniref:hypothetical protein n=1 Tax=Paludibacterium sp. B53371 TaxID=2806263 RepID=UPI001C043B4A|nr:hypothetical protein [Paludibacterium sp. B53371]
MFILVLLVGNLLAQASWAEETDSSWVTITESSNTVWQGKKLSGHLTRVDGKKNAGYVYVYQVKDKQKDTYEFGQVVVLLDTCRKGYGYLFYNDMQGKFTGKDEFVRYGKTVADNLGSMACTSWDNSTGKISHAENGDKWQLVVTATQSRNEYSILPDTVRRRTFGGKPAIAALLSLKDVQADTTTYNEYVMATADCQRGYGTIRTLNFDGAVREQYDVALNGSSVIAAIADTLCKKM